jgi:hypothetical protein
MQEFFIFLVIVILSYLAVYWLLRILHFPRFIFRVLLVLSVVISAFSVLLIMTGKMREMPGLNNLYEQLVAFMDQVMTKLAPYLPNPDLPKK